MNHIEIRFKNIWGLKNDAIDRPILYQNEVIGIIIAVNEEEVTGMIFYEASPQFHSETGNSMGVELIGLFHR